jgi:hypothetical protein
LRVFNLFANSLIFLTVAQGIPVAVASCGVGSCSITTMSSGQKHFLLGWTAATGTGGPGGCRAEYQKPDLTWVTLTTASLDCDSVGSSILARIPADFSQVWTTLPVRLVKISDSSQIVTCGSLMCGSVMGVDYPQPLRDTDCEGQFDNTISTIGFTAWGAVQAMTLTPGNPYDVATLCTEMAGASGAMIFSNNSLTNYSNAGCTTSAGAGSAMKYITGSGTVPSVDGAGCNITSGASCPSCQLDYASGGGAPYLGPGYWVSWTGAGTWNGGIRCKYTTAGPNMTFYN